MIVAVKKKINLRIMMFAATLAAPTDHESEHAGKATRKKLRGTTGALDGHTFLVASAKGSATTSRERFWFFSSLAHVMTLMSNF